MRLGILLLRNSGKQGRLKFLITMIAAAIGILVLLGVFSVTNAIMSSMQRASWRNALDSSSSRSTGYIAPYLDQPDTVIYTPPRTPVSTFLDKSITEFTMYFTGGKIPNASPLTAFPQADEYYVSPALDKLMHKYPDTALRDRFSGKQVGLVPLSALSSPEELVIIHGIDRSSLANPDSQEALNAIPITDFRLSPRGADYLRQSKIVITAAMSIGAIGLIIPTTMLISAAARIGAREREARYAALRLIGATRSQIRRITLLDSLAASVAGILIGVMSFWVLRPSLANIPIGDFRFFPEDVTITPLVFAFIILAILLLVWLANAIALRGIIISPLLVSRKQRVAKLPHFGQAIPFVLCTGTFIYLSTLTAKQIEKTFGEMYPILIATLFVLTMLSLLLAGSWLISRYGVLVSMLNKRAGGVLVSRRIRADARNIFQGIGGVVIAFYAGAFFITSLATIENLAATYTPAHIKALPENSIFTYQTSLTDQPSQQAETIQQLIDKSNTYQSKPLHIHLVDKAVYISCVDAARIFDKKCPGDQTRFINISPDDKSVSPDFDNPKPKLPSDRESNYGVALLAYLPKNDASSPLEAEKIVTAYKRSGHENLSDIFIVNSALRTSMLPRLVDSLRSLLYAGIFLIVIVASLGLAVATVAGIFDRRGSFITLRLGGADISFLKKVVTKESMLPLVAISLLSIACGVLAAYTFLRLSSDMTRKFFILPEPLFWLAVVVAFGLSYLGIRLVLPILDKITNVETNRTE